MLDRLLLSLAVGWRRYVEIFWYLIKEHDMQIPEMSDQLKAAIGGLIVMFLVVLIPQLEPMREHLNAIVGIIIAAILGKPIAGVADAVRNKS